MEERHWVPQTNQQARSGADSSEDSQSEGGGKGAKDCG